MFVFLHSINQSQPLSMAKFNGDQTMRELKRPTVVSVSESVLSCSQQPKCIGIAASAVPRGCKRRSHPYCRGSDIKAYWRCRIHL